MKVILYYKGGSHCETTSDVIQYIDSNLVLDDEVICIIDREYADESDVVSFEIQS